MNNVSLIGRLTKDVEERRTQNGTPVASFTLAVNRRKKEDGADFIPCIAWDKAAETIAKYVHKGDLFGVTGHIQTFSSWNVSVKCNMMALAVKIRAILMMVGGIQVTT